jgi:hypothetical protein
MELIQPHKYEHVVVNALLRDVSLTSAHSYKSEGRVGVGVRFYIALKHVLYDVTFNDSYCLEYIQSPGEQS